MSRRAFVAVIRLLQVAHPPSSRQSREHDPELCLLIRRYGPVIIVIITIIAIVVVVFNRVVSSQLPACITTVCAVIASE